MIVFRLGLADAEILEKEFAPEVRALDLVGLPNYHVYLKLMINGKVSRPFSGWGDCDALSEIRDGSRSSHPGCKSQSLFQFLTCPCSYSGGAPAFHYPRGSAVIATYLDTFLKKEW